MIWAGLICGLAIAITIWLWIKMAYRRGKKETLDGVEAVSAKDRASKALKIVNVVHEYSQARKRIPDNWTDLDRMRQEGPVEVSGDSSSMRSDGGKPKG